MTGRPRAIGILCGGGPAPGINSVVGAATIRAEVSGVPVFGIHDGFKPLMGGNPECCTALSIEHVSRIHFTGGSHLGTSRANPSRNPADLARVTNTLASMGIDALITIGGDDTAFSAMRLAQHAGPGLRIVHVPKTIDNDLDLPYGISTFGFQTARHVGVELVKNLMTDAKTTQRWYLVVTMGRKAGHLALGIGKAAGATLTVIPEEFGSGQGGGTVRLDTLCDILLGAIIKRRSMGHRDGTAIVAEGLVERLASEDLEQFGDLERDEHDHIRLAEVNLGEVLKRRLRIRLGELKLDTALVTKDIGYELRCADPIPFDMEYTRDLGYCATQFLLDGGANAMVTLVNGHFEPIPFASMLDPTTGRTRIRLVDINSEQYRIARSYMVSLCAADLSDELTLRSLAATAGLSAPDFAKRFAHVLAGDSAKERGAAGDAGHRDRG